MRWLWWGERNSRVDLPCSIAHLIPWCIQSVPTEMLLNATSLPLQLCLVLTSNLHLLDDGPCRLNIRYGNVLFFLGKEELIEDLQRRLAIHSLVNQGPKIAAADTSSGSSGSTHGCLSMVRYFVQCCKVSKKDAKTKRFCGVVRCVCRLYWCVLEWTWNLTIFKSESLANQIGRSGHGKISKKEEVLWRQHFESRLVSYFNHVYVSFILRRPC